MFSQIVRSSSRAKPVYVCSSCLCTFFRPSDLPISYSGIGEILSNHHPKSYSTTPARSEAKDAHEPDSSSVEPSAPVLSTKTNTPITRRRRKSRTKVTKPISQSELNLRELRQALAQDIDESKRVGASKITETETLEEKSKEKPLKKKRKKTSKDNVNEQQSKASEDVDRHRIITKGKAVSATKSSAVVENKAAPTSTPKFPKHVFKEPPGVSAPMNSYLIKLLGEGRLSKQQRSRVLRYLSENLASKPDSRSTSPIRHVKSKSPVVSDINEVGEELSERLKTFQSLRDAMKSKAPPRPRRQPSVKAASGLQKRPGTTPLEIETIDAGDLHLTPVDRPQPPVPKLSYGLERVLFNPGVYQLQDPRSRVYNFDPYLQTIMPVSEFDFNALKEYITSSKDVSLLETASTENKKYTGSTSSMTSGLAHFHFLLSQWRPIHTGILSQDFPIQHKSFTALQRGPSAIFLRWRDGTYAIDADKQYDTANILSMLGKSMEKLLTLSTEDFEKYRKENSDQISEEERNEAESFHYTTMGDFLMRSQLDAHDPRLPGTGMFDLKTRAVVSIRMDAREYEKGMGYEIRTRHGEWESYEREYYDMIRAAFLKYSLQVRMGRMDGIFVAYHNTERIFGFQYISLPEMDLALHGTEDPSTGDSEFKISLELLNRILDRATARFPEKSLRIHFETRAAETPFMYIFAEPIEEEMIQKIQETNKDTVREFESRVLGLKKEKTDEELKTIEWEKIRAKVEESVEKDETSMQDARAIVQSLIEQSDVLRSEELTEQTDRLLDEILSASGVNDSTQDDEDDDRGNEEEIEEEDDVDDLIEEGSEELDEDDIEEPGLGEADDEPDIETISDDSIEEEGDKDMQDSGQEIDVNGVGDERDEGEQDNSEEPVQKYTEGGAEKMNDLTPHADSSGIKMHSSDFPDHEASEDSLVPKDIPVVEDVAPTALNVAQATGDSPTGHTEEPESKPPSEDDILAMTLTIRNKVNDQYVLRPENLGPTDEWTVEYALSEVPNQARAKTLYEATKRRRRLALAKTNEEAKSNPYNDNYMQKLAELAERGRDWRKRQNEVDREAPKKTLHVQDTAPLNRAEIHTEPSNDEEIMQG
ncbi:hypothetical protein B7463_g9442, partial [Scytalidium lignicola]